MTTLNPAMMFNMSEDDEDMEEMINLAINMRAQQENLALTSKFSAEYMEAITPKTLRNSVIKIRNRDTKLFVQAPNNNGINKFEDVMMEVNTRVDKLLQSAIDISTRDVKGDREYMQARKEYLEMNKLEMVVIKKEIERQAIRDSKVNGLPVAGNYNAMWLQIMLFNSQLIIGTLKNVMAIDKLKKEIDVTLKRMDATMYRMISSMLDNMERKARRQLK